MITYSASLQAQTEHVWIQEWSHMMHKHPKDNSEALAAFLAKRAAIDTNLARLTALSADHFGADPDFVNWGTVGTLKDYARHLRRITDAVFKEGEYAE